MFLKSPASCSQSHATPSHQKHACFRYFSFHNTGCIACEASEIQIQLLFHFKWNQRMKIQCPQDGNQVSQPLLAEPVPRIEMLQMENEPSEYDYPTIPLISSFDDVQNSSNQIDDSVLPEYIKSSFLGISCSPPISASSCQGHLPCRRSERQKLSCGICFRPAFVADGGPATEAWILCCNREHPFTIPACPTAIPQHLICFRCCPINRQGHIEPHELVEHLTQGRRPILTIDEFCIKGGMRKAFFKYYAFSTGSKVDYEAKCLYQRQVSLNDFFPSNCKSSVRTKSEEPVAPVSSISTWRGTARLRSVCGICSESAFVMERCY